MSQKSQNLGKTILVIADNVSRVISKIPKTILTEIHLRYYKSNTNPDKKILAVWDFNQIQARLGDFIVFLECLSVMRHNFNLKTVKCKNIDICFVDDPEHSNRKYLMHTKSYFFKKLIKSITGINPYINLVINFSSNKEFEQFYQKNRSKYLRWPATVAYTKDVDGRMIEKYYDKHKYIPKLILEDEILTEIYSWYNQHFKNKIPIVLNIRNNKRSQERNSNIKELSKFIDHYLTQKPNIIFIIICNKEEFPSEFKNKKNVIFSKDHFADIEYDLAFIKSSYLSIFPSSGMSGFAFYTDVPFIVYGNHMYGNGTVPNKGENLNFLKEYQTIFHRPESSEWLIEKVEEKINYLKKINKNNFKESKPKQKVNFDSKF